MYVRTVQLASKFTLNASAQMSLAEFLRVLASYLRALARASQSFCLRVIYLDVHDYCTSAKYLRAFVHVRT